MERAGERRRGWAPVLLAAGLMTVAIAILASVLDPGGRCASSFFLLHVLGVLLVIASAVVAIISGGAAVRTRRRVVLGVGATLMAIHLLGSAALWWALGGHYGLIRLKYGDEWIIGSSITEVEERYGEAEECGGHGYCYLLYEDEAAIMPSHLVVRYAMFTDEDGVVTEVDDHYCPGDDSPMWRMESP